MYFSDCISYMSVRQSLHLAIYSIRNLSFERYSTSTLYILKININIDAYTICNYNTYVFHSNSAPFKRKKQKLSCTACHSCNLYL